MPLKDNNLKDERFPKDAGNSDTRPGSYYFTPGDVFLTSSTLGDILDKSADHNGNANIFISAFQGISKTLSEFRQEADKLASGLLFLGLEKGDRIGIFCPNCYEWLLTQFAAAKAGLILVTINPVSTSKELEYCLKKVGCKSLVMWDVLRSQDFYGVLAEIVPNLVTSNPNKLQSEKLPSLRTVIMISKERKGGVLNFQDVLTFGNKESGEILSAMKRLIQFDDPLCIMFTSGTTGEPKGALLSHHNVVNNAMLMGKRIVWNSTKTVTCCFVPLFHVYGYSVAVIQVMFQLKCVLPSPKYDVVAILTSIEEYKCTSLHGTPTMYVDLIHHHKTLGSNIDSLQQATFGGAGNPEALLADVRSILNVNRLQTSYGATEMSPALAVNGLTDDSQKADAMDAMEPLEYTEVKIIDSKGCIVPINTQGEICARGHNIFMGYWNDEKKTAEVLDKTRWYHTGDLGEMNESGWIKIVGRIKDMIIRGGENIYPLEVENFLNTHPSVRQVHVCGVPDQRMGEEACAWISLVKGTTLTEEEVRKYCKGQISPFKIPRYVLFVDDFPKTGSGKVKKYEMTKISIEKLGL